MTKERLTLFDTTLRDGAQTTGVDFSLADKRHIAAMLDGLGIDYIEGGYPGANPADTAFFASAAEIRACALRRLRHGEARRAARSRTIRGLPSLFEADADAITFVAKAWDYHVRVALGSTLEENLDAIRQSIAAARVRGREVDPRLRAFLRRVQGQCGLCAQRRRGRLRGGRALDRALRHQWRDAAA